MQVAVIGPTIDLRYDYLHLGEDPCIIKQIENGKHAFAEKLKNAKKPLVILGSDTLSRSDGAAILAAVQSISRGLQDGLCNSEWKVLNILHKVANQVT